MLVDRPAAIVAGPSALALAAVLKLPEVQRALLAQPRWMTGPEFAATISAIHLASEAYLNELRNNEAKPSEAGRGLSRVPGDAEGVGQRWSSSRVAQHLGISTRRAQQLAAARQLDAELVGGRWLIDAESVRTYSQVRSAA
jgi:hypothetical protein